MKQTTKKAAAPPIERPHKDLTRIQEEVADLASDILLNGGTKEDVDSILTALLRHRYKRLSFAQRKPADEMEKEANAEASRYKESYYQRLCKHWPEKRQETADEPIGPERPVKEMVRANIRESLLDKVEQLLTDTDGIETVWLLNEIVENINSGEEPGEAISQVLDRAEIYVRVPWQHKKRIEEFVAFLEKGRAAA
jgi:hypothetical protein